MRLPGSTSWRHLGPLPRATRRRGARTLAAIVAIANLTSCRTQPPPNSLVHVPDSAWISVTGPTIVGFFPLVSDAEIERNEDLAMALDNVAYHLGTATDSLEAQGFAVTMRAGDTLWFRNGDRRWVFARAGDSSDVGYYLTAPDQRSLTLYGLHTHVDLVARAWSFANPRR